MQLARGGRSRDGDLFIFSYSMVMSLYWMKYLKGKSEKKHVTGLLKWEQEEKPVKGTGEQ